MKIRSHPVARSLCLAAAALAFAFPLAGCGASKAPTDAPGAGAAAPGSDAASATGGRRRMAQILMTLGLSDDQKSQIRSIMRATRKENANADPTTRRANFKDAIAKIDALLTPDQRAKMHAQLGGRRAGRGDQTAPPQS